MQINQVMTSYSPPNFYWKIYDEKGYLNQFVSEIFDSLQ